MRHAVVVAALLATLPTALFSSPTAVAADVKTGDITVERAWARASAGPVANGVAYFTLENRGGADRLLAAASSAAERVELHAHIRDGEVMKMRPVEAIDIGAGQTVTLMPGGLHVMLMGLKAPLKEGATLPLTLTFEKAGRVEFQAQILAPGSRGPAGHEAGGHGPMGGMGGHK